MNGHNAMTNIDALWRLARWLGAAAASVALDVRARIPLADGQAECGKPGGPNESRSVRGRGITALISF